MKHTLHTLPVNAGAFSCQPARALEIEDERILCNDITLPWEFNPHRIRLWIIGNEFGALGAVWAGSEQDAFDALVDEGLGDSLLVSDPTQEDDENPDLCRLGNAGELADLCNAWIAQVHFDDARDIRLLCAFAEARGSGSKTLYS